MKGLHDSSVGKEPACNAGDPGSIPGSGRSTAEGIGYPLQYSWASLVAQLVKNLPEMQETWVGKIPWRRKRLPTAVFRPGEFHGPYSPCSHKESDRTEKLSLSFVDLSFCSIVFEIRLKKKITKTNVKSLLPMFSFKSFRTSGLAFNFVS